MDDFPENLVRATMRLQEEQASGLIRMRSDSVKYLRTDGRPLMGVSGGSAVVDFDDLPDPDWGSATVTDTVIGGAFDGHQAVIDAHANHYAFYEDGFDPPTIEVRSVGRAHEFRLAPMPDPLTHVEHGVWYRVEVVDGVPTIRKLGD